MQTVEQLVDSVSRLVSLPEVYLRVREIVENPRARMADLAGAIVRDPALTARLLRIANSAVFGHSGRVETVTRAVTLLGSRPLLDLVLATSVTRAFAGVSPARMDVQTFWRRSVYCGVVARNLATRCNVLDVERLFVEGLLRDVGHLVLFDRLPEQADAALKRAAETGRPVAEVERATLSAVRRASPPSTSSTTPETSRAAASAAAVAVSGSTPLLRQATGAMRAVASVPVSPSAKASVSTAAMCTSAVSNGEALASSGRTWKRTAAHRPSGSFQRCSSAAPTSA
ncbi:MAG: HDOD domain-containing protein [Gammaproteobacteria bacterium]|nr:HDOD domain-containing protein [Gammaproteobacteria bacterium]